MAGTSRLLRNWACPTSAGLPELQIRGNAALALGFATVSRHRVVGPWQPPIRGALGRPDEIRRAVKMRQRPSAVICDIADKSKFAAWLQNARHRGDGRI